MENYVSSSGDWRVLQACSLDGDSSLLLCLFCAKEMDQVDYDAWFADDL